MYHYVLLFRELFLTTLWYIYMANILILNQEIVYIYVTFQCARSPGGSKCKRGLPVQFSVHFNHFQMTNS